MSVAKKRKESTVDDPLPALDGKELEAHIEKMREFQRTPLHVEIENGMLKVFWGTGDTPAARRIVHSFPVTYSLGLGDGGWIHLWDAHPKPDRGPPLQCYMYHLDDLKAKHQAERSSFKEVQVTLASSYVPGRLFIARGVVPAEPAPVSKDADGDLPMKA